jgi:hypothetical protein
MKALIASVFFIFIVSGSSIACDVCGGGNSSAFNGYIPQFGKSQITLGYDQRRMANVIYRNESVAFSIQQWDLGWRYFSKKNLYFNATLPIKRFQLERAQSTQQVNGIGDLRLAINYIWRGKNMDRSWKPLLLGGITWKSTTGKYMVRDFSKQMMPLYLQNGTGANALQLSVYGQWANRHMGIWFNGFEQFNGINEMQEQWGEKKYFQMGFFAHTNYFSFLKKSNQWWMNFSFVREENKAMKSYQIPIDGTAGNVYFFTTQLDWYVGDWVFTAYASQAFSGWDNTNIPISKSRMGMNIVFIIPKKMSE